MKTPGLLSTWPLVEEFIFAGNATFTLKSLKTGTRFTYKVRVKKEDLTRLEKERALAAEAARRGCTLTLVPSFTEADVTYFVNLLRGPDNESDFAYMGVLRKYPVRFFWTAASGKVGRGAPAYRALLWMIDAMRCERAVLGEQLEVWHEDRCACCGRKLTVPESIVSGFGPFCKAKEAA